MLQQLPAVPPVPGGEIDHHIEIAVLDPRPDQCLPLPLDAVLGLVIIGGALPILGDVVHRAGQPGIFHPPPLRSLGVAPRSALSYRRPRRRTNRRAGSKIGRGPSVTGAALWLDRKSTL